MTGTIAIVKGMLSTIAERNAETHRTTTIARIGCSRATSTIDSASRRMSPVPATPPTTTNSAAKKTRTDQSTSLSSSSGLGLTRTKAIPTPMRATVAGLRCKASWRKKRAMTIPRAKRIFFREAWSVRASRGSICISASTF
jgi:hypothetical protein